MSSYGKYRIVKKQGSNTFEIARDFISPRGVDLAFDGSIRIVKD